MKTPTAHEKYAAQVRAEGRTCTPYRLGLAVGAAGDNLPSPYQPGTRGDHLYLDGVEYGRTERRINAKACALYHASSANDPSPAWWELTGAQKWPWREKAIEALAAEERARGVGAAAPDLDAITADAERLCWALRPLVRLVPAGPGECWLRFKVGVQEFTIGSEPMPEDEAAHFAGLFVFALASAFRTLPAGVPAAGVASASSGTTGIPTVLRDHHPTCAFTSIPDQPANCSCPPRGVGGNDGR